MNLTNQQIFDKAVTALLKQNQRSGDPGSYAGCQYRGPNGLKCAVGHLIDDACYQPLMEGRSIPSPKALAAHQDTSVRKSLDALMAALACSNIDHASSWELLSDLQNTHDTNPIPDWAESFRAIAAKFSLSPEAITTWEAKQKEGA